MICNEYQSVEIERFLKGREYLLANEHCWIKDGNQELAITTMVAGHQLNCMKWLVTCLDKLLKENKEVNDEMRPLIIKKMDEFQELFPISLKNESKDKRAKYKVDFKEIKDEFKRNLKK